VAGAAFDEQLEALEQGRAFVDLQGWGLTEVRGADAEGWLNDLVTASVDGIPEGEALRSFLLSPTGRIRADLHVLRARSGDGFLLLQDADQPDAIADLLRPYVLSSDVELAPADPRGLLVKPRPGLGWTTAWGGARDDGSVPAGSEAIEAWRIRHGLARFPVDLDADSLPAEADLDVEPVIDRSKGCYLGQESVARVRNLGHPPRVVVGVRADLPLRPGAPIRSQGAQVGSVTSVEPRGGTSAMVRIRWDARDTELTADGGIALERREPTIGSPPILRGP
jgi:tRNA-modifying protein YgfZ